MAKFSWPCVATACSGTWGHTPATFSPIALAAPIAGVAIERTGYDAVWVMSAVAAAAGAITAWRWLEPAATVAADAEVVSIAAPAR